MTLGTLYYEGPHMLEKHISIWKSYPEYIKNKIQFVVVDDGSNKYPAREVVENSGLNIDLYEILYDYPWNTGGARNLISYAASEKWILMMDLDHVIDQENIIKLFNIELSNGVVYKFQRFSVKDNKFIRGHAESLLIEKELYWNIGGYDEDFLKYGYGGERPFFKQLSNKAKDIIRFNDIYLTHYSRKIISDSEVNRSEMRKQNRRLLPEFLKEKEHLLYKPKNPIRFNWKKVY